MNRLKKEALKKHLEARKGLTPEEVAELDRLEQIDRELTENVNQIHSLLFPEEYDWYYDSISERKDREAGINPMSERYIEKTNRRRAALGFSEYSQGFGRRTETLDWVRKKLAEGQEPELREILARREIDDNTEEAVHAEEALKIDIDAAIDTMLGEGKFPVSSGDETKPDALPFRVLGCCMSLKASKYLNLEKMFIKQIRRLLPGLPDKEYKLMYDKAFEKWSDTYFPY